MIIGANFTWFSFRTFHYLHVLDTEAKPIEKTDESVPVPRSNKVSSICLNIPAAGLGSRPASIISTSTSDEGGFNEPYPEIKAKLKPHECTHGTNNQSNVEIINVINENSNESKEASELEIDDDDAELEPKKVDLVSDSVEPLYAVPYKPNKHKNNVKYLQKSGDTDVMHDSKITNDAILSPLDNQESFEKSNDDNGDNTLYNSSSSKDSEVSKCSN